MCNVCVACVPVCECVACVRTHTPSFRYATMCSKREAKASVGTALL